MVAIPNPLVALIGAMIRPKDWRVPIVTIRMPAAARVMAMTPGRLSERSMAGTCGEIGQAGIGSGSGEL
ncbi:MAG: hypothetical protein CAPSK01_002083 [Candidatus Accumulibacter vicinus]|uniref:Uncharacterized protein n=1 Tax=Candidatus Accumulibacter vicinus TaxID=2954382 RepID=A0A084Y0I6_9PROT|nr:MAG: hypothetical protein CAPSK01_002083 [Candidatus Accumulibacter vicinus]